ncbi:hypothetical protein F0919_13380 [Taibaiella lutea]|uniref:Porin n=1 Tax=Taibaiella lutea TaxID=2608001 RepID=A0A5M6CEP6_9BACT|nr:hypothetical protein [Taibaiella lutea]KAA5533527.1 hypothetical protein F0919_13380 [Taibaiella lutea]
MFRQVLLGLGIMLLGVTSEAQDTVNLKSRIQPGMTPAQQLIANTGEDLLTGNNAGHSQTVISGYGQGSYQRDFQYQSSKINLDRVVLFVGHQFNNNIAFFSELEVTDARVENGKPKGEIGMEQAYLKFSLNPRQYFVAGLFIPRIGILNENHLPTNYNGVERPLVEQLVIPSTWSEMGIGFYGQMSTLPIAYSIAALNGLDASSFSHGTGIGGGKGEGSFANANNLAFTAAVKAFVGDFQIQVSGYAGGTIGASHYTADSIGLQSGMFAAPLYLGEADVQYSKAGFTAKLLGTYISYPDAGDINRAYANNTPSAMYGAYAELGYNFFETIKSEAFDNKQLIGFVRYEKLDLNSKIPENGIYDGTLKQSHLIAGLNFMPIPNITIKADVRLTSTGPLNKALQINPPPVSRIYPEQNQFLNIGFGYSF